MIDRIDDLAMRKIVLLGDELGTTEYDLHCFDRANGLQSRRGITLLGLLVQERIEQETGLELFLRWPEWARTRTLRKLPAKHRRSLLGRHLND